MKKQNNVTSKDIEKMSYTDFVGFINQWNVLPGAYDTLSRWKTFSEMDKNSKILEIACTTGFSSRELALATGCKGKAFDLSEPSIDSAIENKKLYAKNIKIDYFVQDGTKFKTNERFSHIIVGAALQFFPEPKKMLNKCITLLSSGGYILASPFFITKPLPESLVREFKTVFGIKPTTISYKNIMKMYRGLEIFYEERKTIEQETQSELDHYCQSTIVRACQLRGITSKQVKKTMYGKLMRIKVMSNKLRPYQGYSVLVLKFRSHVFPNRYVELF